METLSNHQTDEIKRELEDVKDLIISILLPYAEGLIEDSLMFRYKEKCGRDIPYGKFNFRNLVSFLKSIKDVVYLTSLPQTGVTHCQVVPNETIMDQFIMVRRQRKSKGDYKTDMILKEEQRYYGFKLKLLGPGKPGGKPEQNYQARSRSQMPASRLSMGQQQQQQPRRQRSLSRSGSIVSLMSSRPRMPERDVYGKAGGGGHSNIDYPYSDRQNHQSQRPTSLSREVVQTSSDRSEWRDDYRQEKQQQYQQQQQQYQQQQQQYQQQQQQQRQVNVPDDDNLGALLSLLPEGSKTVNICSVDFQKRFLEKFGQSLGCNEVDVEELRELFRSKSIKQYVDVREDPFSRASMLVSRKVSSQRSQDQSPPTPESSSAMDLQPKKLFPQQWPTEIKEGDRLEVIVGEAFTPDRFYVNLKSKEWIQDLKHLMDQMKEFYSSGEGRKWVLPRREAVMIGQFAAATYETLCDWHRCVISKVMADGRLQLFYVDYGSVKVVNPADVRVLDDRFKVLGYQAFRACLAQIRPSSGAAWGEQAIDCFHELLAAAGESPFVAVYCGRVKSKADAVSLVLVDTASNDLPDGININKELVRQNFAAVQDRSGGGDASWSDQGRQASEEVLAPPPHWRQPLPLPGSATTANHQLRKPITSAAVKKDWIEKRLDKLQIEEASFVHGDTSEANSTFYSAYQDESEDDAVALQHGLPPPPPQAQQSEVTWPVGFLDLGGVENRATSGGSKKEKEIYLLRRVPLVLNPKSSTASGPEGNRVWPYLISMDGVPHLTTADISSLFPKWEGRDVLEKMIKLNEATFSRRELVFSACTSDFFEACIVEGVSGAESGRLVVYPLKEVPNMLMFFGKGQDNDHIRNVCHLIKTVLDEL